MSAGNIVTRNIYNELLPGDRFSIVFRTFSVNVIHICVKELGFWIYTHSLSQLVGISVFASMIPEIIEIVGNQQKYGGSYQVNISNQKSRRKL